MKCVKIIKPGQVEICEMPMPVPKKGEALLKMLYGGICGSDIGSYRGTFTYVSYPRIPGHEMSCEIAEIEENDLGLKKGMIVTCNPYFNCGSCYTCKRGFLNCCEHNETMGSQRDGAFCEYITMPVERIYNGHGLDAKTLALIEPFCIARHAIARVSLKPGENVFIAGAGPIGLLTMKAAKLYGANVFMSDVAAVRLEQAMQMGADGVIRTGQDDFAKKTAEFTGGNGFDVCIEAAGLPSAFIDCIDATAYRARVLVIGVSKKNVDFNYTLIQKKELEIYGSRNSLKEDFLALIDLVSKDDRGIPEMINSVYDLNDAQKAFEACAAGTAGLKTLIRF
jgi:threonine dehydrogenase-like Zn-dependent dehydrogenase